MRTSAMGSIVLLAAALANAATQPQPTAAEVISVFQQYERINSDFVSSVGSGKGTSGKSYDRLRREAEAYAEGPFEQALESAVTLVCTGRNASVVRALFKVKLATRNSASESPAIAMGRMFICAPALVSHEVKAAGAAMQELIYPELEWGFENAVLDSPPAGENVDVLRRRLRLLAPHTKQ